MAQETWNNFWKQKGSSVEWNKEDLADSEVLKTSSAIISAYLQQDFQKLNLLELGSGVGLTSFYFANKGINITLLDSSPDAKELAKKFWANQKHSFLCKDLFSYKGKRYDIVTSFGLCEHFSGQKRTDVLKKHVDLMAKPGIAIISVPYKYGIFYRMMKFLSEAAGKWDFGEEIPFSKREIIDFSKEQNIHCDILMRGFYSSLYDLFRKPMKLLGINLRRRFDNTPSMFDRILGCGMVVVLKK